MRNIERLALAGSTVGLALMLNFGERGSNFVNAGGSESTPTPTVIPRPEASATSTPTATPNALATQIANTKATLDQLTELQRSLDALRNPTPVIVSPPQPQQVPPPGVIIVHPDVVKPEVVKPEVVKVPEIVKVEVPVPATPPPDSIITDRKALDHFIEEGVSIALTARAGSNTPTSTPIPLPIPAIIERKGWSFDWWSGLIAGLIGGVVGLGIGATVFTRERVVDRIYHHYHP